MTHNDNELSHAELSPVELDLVLTGIAHGGESVGRADDGRVVFARYGIPGERVTVRVSNPDPEARMWRGDVVSVHEASPHRVPHVWPAADPLGRGTTEAGRVQVPGGADFGHIELAHQRELKTRIVAEQLARIGGIDVNETDYSGVLPPLTDTADGLGWRTRMAYAIDEQGRIAMRQARSHALIPTPTMPLEHPKLAALKLGEVDLTGLEKIELAVSNTDEPPLILAVPTLTETGEETRAARSAIKRLSNHIASNTTANQDHDAPAASIALLNQVRGAASDGRGRVERITGRTWLIQTVLTQSVPTQTTQTQPGQRQTGQRPTAGSYSYRVTGEGFWQIHSSAPETLMHDVMAYAQAQPGQRWLDLYAGAGLFTAALADAVGERGEVISIEGAPGTHRDAKRNLKDAPQARIVQDRVERALAQLGHNGGGGRNRRHRNASIDGIVLDPPRAGAGKSAISRMLALEPGRIVYVACDPAAFARDARQLVRGGYRLESLTGRDLYPHTHHIETIALFTPTP